jgi:hypothetical protein
MVALPLRRRPTKRDLFQDPYAMKQRLIALVTGPAASAGKITAD